VIALWSNPEFIRNVRGQLRPGKVIATACICAAISIAVGFAISRASHVAAGPYGWGTEILQVAIWLQALMLAAGGGIACINSIYREKEQNTFDFQRVTQMTPLELTLGKLFGAPIFTYFVTLCMMPLAIFGAVMGKTQASVVLAAYAVLFVGSLATHVLALLISLLTVRGSHTGAILLLLVLLWGSSVSGSNLQFFHVGPFGPFYAAQLAQRGSWIASGMTARGEIYDLPGVTDSFFGMNVSHVPVFIAVDLLFAGWFLLAVVRNIKRDPNYYEIYSPVQALGFAIFINLLFVAFFRWRSSTPIDCQAYMLTLNIAVFFCLGVAMIRNRERMRRILRARETKVSSWLDVTWPAPLLIAGTLAVGLLVVAGISIGRDPKLEWNLSFAVFRSLFFVAWLGRDLQYLQWMSLRRGKHTLAIGVLFLFIFYVCVNVVLAAFGFYSVEGRVPFSAFFVPSPIYLLDHPAWVLRPAIWGAAFVTQWIVIAVFVGLQQRTLAELSSPSQGSVPDSAPAAVYL
jgi:hypothetical protein